MPRIPTAEALTPVVGWIMLWCAACAALLLILRHEGWRRLWLRAEDPRTMGLFRIAFGVCAMCNINGLWELYTYLFTDEGLFMTDVARHVFAREQFEGFGNGLDRDPLGFLDWQGFWQFLRGPKYSLLFFWSSPTAFWIHWAAFQLAIVALIVGYKTAYTKWIAWFLFHSIIQRNTVFWEGTENVFRTFFFYLCLSRCGHAYSLDNWLRCRALRRVGRLSERGSPGNGAGAPPSADLPQGLEAVYRRIPAWPRLLVILQCGAIYCYTGVAKTGSIWWSGDAFYYALNLDHFYRFPPQQLSAWLGTNVMRLNTHVVHAWESLFPLVIVGLVFRFGRREHLPHLGTAARWTRRFAWIGLALGALAVCEVLLPTAYKGSRRGFLTLERLQIGVAFSWALFIVAVAWFGHRLRTRPFSFWLRRRHVRIELEGFLKWTMGRRIWLFVGVVFHLHLMVLMNIGWFQPAALTGFICFLNGGEVAVGLAMIGRLLGRLRVPGVPAATLRGLAPLPPEDPLLPHTHTDGVRLPLATMLAALGLTVVAVPLAAYGVVVMGWSLLGVAAFVGGATFVSIRATPPSLRTAIVERPLETSKDLQATAPWAYGPWGRCLANALVIYHVVGVTCWLVPKAPGFEWRDGAREPFKAWLETTQTTQGWSMFAPNPPRANRFLRVLVTDRSGETWDMNSDVYAPEKFPLPMIWYTRERKINRRISGGEGGKGSWYQKWHARWVCRDWALAHDGVLPKQVELRAISYSIPAPTWVKEHGPYDPVERRQKSGHESSLYVAQCADEPDGQPPHVILERHGVQPSEVGVRRWGALRGKAKSWSTKQARSAKGEP